MSVPPESQPKTLLVLIGEDPRASARPSEAVRVAAGIGAWKKVRVNIYLHGPALACASEPSEEFEQGEIIAQHLPSISLHGGEIFGEKAVRSGSIKVSLAKSLPKLLAGHDAFMNFGVPVEALGPRAETGHLTAAALFDRMFEVPRG